MAGGRKAAVVMYAFEKHTVPLKPHHVVFEKWGFNKYIVYSLLVRIGFLSANGK